MSMSASDLLLPPHLQQFIQDQIDRGNYSKPSEVICAALVLMRERAHVQSVRLERVRADIQLALDELDRGEGSTLDIEEIKQRLRERFSIEQ